MSLNVNNLKSNNTAFKAVKPKMNLKSNIVSEKKHDPYQNYQNIITFLTFSVMVGALLVAAVTSISNAFKGLNKADSEKTDVKNEQVINNQNNVSENESTLNISI